MIPKGVYKIAQIRLQDNVTLFVQRGATLVSQTCEENENSEIKAECGVIFAENAGNITVTGGGTIDGCGESYTFEPQCVEPLYALKYFNLYTRVIESRKRLRKAKPVNRPSIIHFRNCNNIKVNNIVLKDASFWTFHLDNCENTEIFNLVINNQMHIANTDGIDVSGGKNVSIHHTFIATADDGIVIKSPENPVKNVNVQDSVISSFANCFKIGTETKYDIEDIKVDGCYFFMPDGITGGYSGIAVETADGSIISNVSISNIEMHGVSAAFLVWAGKRMKYGQMPIGKIQNVTIENITADNIELPSAINGTKDEQGGMCIKNVTVRNVTAQYRDTNECLSIMHKVPEISLSDYPEITRVAHIYFHSHEMSRYWDLPCYGLYIRNSEPKTDNFNCIPRRVNKRKKIVKE